MVFSIYKPLVRIKTKSENLLFSCVVVQRKFEVKQNNSLQEFLDDFRKWSEVLTIHLSLEEELDLNQIWQTFFQSHGDDIVLAAWIKKYGDYISPEYKSDQEITTQQEKITELSEEIGNRLQITETTAETSDKESKESLWAQLYEENYYEIVNKCFEAFDSAFSLAADIQEGINKKGHTFLYQDSESFLDLSQSFCDQREDEDEELRQMLALGLPVNFRTTGKATSKRRRLLSENPIDVISSLGFKFRDPETTGLTNLSIASVSTISSQESLEMKYEEIKMDVRKAQKREHDKEVEEEQDKKAKKKTEEEEEKKAKKKTEEEEEKKAKKKTEEEKKAKKKTEEEDEEEEEEEDEEEEAEEEEEDEDIEDFEVEEPVSKKTKKRRRNNRKKPELPVVIKNRKSLLKYWKKRFSLFSRFDDGIQLDEESWFSVTPEKIAINTANRLKCDIIIDAFCGCGGNTIQFALKCEKVIAIDIDPNKIKMAKHNAKIYKVDHKIEFIIGDFIDLIPKLKADCVFLSPPWGGPNYKNCGVYDIERDLFPLPATFLMNKSREISQNIALFLPRNSNTNQIIRLCGVRKNVEIEQNFLNKKLIALTAYFGDLIKEEFL